VAHPEVHTKFPYSYSEHIILACLALHNFIHDSKLEDREFDRCDEDKD
jgi:hypothetical protein